MKLGFNITSEIPPGMDPRAMVASQLDEATYVRDCGFYHITLGNRFSFGPATTDHRGEAPTRWQLQPFPLLAHIAGRLGADLKYGTSILLSTPLHPVQLAEDMATLDAICAGGLRVGIGLGWQPYELEAFGVEKSTRVKRFEELVTLTSALLTSPSVTFDGEFYQVRDACLVARGVQQPRPPIWLGATVAGAVKRAARIADSWTVSGHTPLADLVPLMAIYRAELEKCGRPLPQERPINRRIYLANDRRTAIEEAGSIYAEKFRDKAGAGWFVAKDRKWEPAELDEMPFIVGNPDDCIEQISRIGQSLGVNMMSLSPLYRKGQRETRLNAISLLAKEVLPHFKESDPY